MFCQACGAKNTADARFCNQCGARIASLGAPGGPVAAGTMPGAISGETYASSPGAYAAPAPFGNPPAGPPVGGPPVGAPFVPGVPFPAPTPAPVDVPASPALPAAAHVSPGHAHVSPGHAHISPSGQLAAPHLAGVAGRAAPGGPVGGNVTDVWRYAQGTRELQPLRGAPLQASETLEAARSPFSTGSMAGVSLEQVGVRSSARTWLALISAGLALFALGAALAWFAGRSSGPSEVAGGSASPDDPFLIGAPIASGSRDVEGDDEAEDDPDDGPTASSAARGDASNGAKSATRDRATSTARTAPSRATKGASTSGRAGSATGAGRSGGGHASERAGEREDPDEIGPRGSAGGSGANGSEASGASSASTTSRAPTTESDATGSDATGSDATGSDATGSDATGTAPSEVGDERDVEMGLYTSRVRYVVTRYYAARAQSCFDRATRNQPTVSGTVIVGMTIGESGQVTAADVRRNSTGDTELGGCLISQVRSWRLPAPPGGALELEMPFSR